MQLVFKFLALQNILPALRRITAIPKPNRLIVVQIRVSFPCLTALKQFFAVPAKVRVAYSAFYDKSAAIDADIPNHFQSPLLCSLLIAVHKRLFHGAKLIVVKQ